MCFYERVANQYAWFEADQHALFCKDDATHAIGGLTDDFAVELADVLVSVGREVVPTVLVQSQVKLRSVLNNRLV